MRWLAQIGFALKALFLRRKLDEQLSEEVRTHVEMATEANVAKGMSPEEARYAALREFGNVAGVQERAREGWGWVGLELWIRDLRLSLRSLRRSPGYSAAIVITLALCIGANTTILSALYGLILKPLPFREAGQLVEIYNSQPKGGQPKQPASVPQYLDYRAKADRFEQLALWRTWTVNLDTGTGPIRGIGAMVTPDLFALLDIQPLLGRFFTEEDGTPGRERVLVLTQTLWEENYQADPAVVNRVIQLGGEPFTIIGVAPRSLEAFKADTAFLKPFLWPAEIESPRGRMITNASLYARLKSGITPAAGLAQLQEIENQFQDTLADPLLLDYLKRSEQGVALGRIRVEQTKAVQNGLFMLQGGALLVLLLGGVNVASLMLARAQARRSELAIRQALGAGRMALTRQLMSEAVLLAATGALIGLALTWASLGVINTYTPIIIRDVPPVALDGTILGLTLLTTLGVTLLIGLLPVWRLWRSNLPQVITSGVRDATGGGGIRALNGWLVTTQVALALMLMIGAGLLIRSFANVMAVAPGFDAPCIIHGRVAFNATQDTPAALRALQDRIVAAMREISGVEAVSFSSHLPVGANFPDFTTLMQGQTLGPEASYPTGSVLGVSPDFLSTMGIRLLEGRDFTAADIQPQARAVLIVDRNFADKYFPGRSAVGARFGLALDETAPGIVGVAEVARLSGREDRTNRPLLYAVKPFNRGGFSLELRTTRPLAEIEPLMRAQLRTVDPALPLYQVSNLEMNLDEAVVNRRGIMLLLGIFAGIALLLAALGIYGMLAYDVAQRTNEIGVRGAIGASRGQIVVLILRQGLGKAGVGLALGLIGTLCLSRFLSSLLFGVKPTDPVAFIGVSVLLLVVATFAAWLPARRAARVDPLIALRAE